MPPPGVWTFSPPAPLRITQRVPLAENSQSDAGHFSAADDDVPF